MERDLLQEGIAAFQLGDRARAQELLLMLVEVDPKNEKAWYYLAAAESRSALRMEYLEHVLEINPENARAREVLERLKARETTPAAEPETPVERPPSSSRIRPLDPTASGVPSGASPARGGFAPPFDIPGAPARVTFESLYKDGVSLLRSAFRSFSRVQIPGMFSGELSRATWWRFWLLSGTASVLSALLILATAIVIELRAPASLFSFFTILLTPILSIPLMLIMQYAGVYASHRYAVANGGGGTLVRHAYGVALRWMPMVVVNAALSFVFDLLGLGADLLFVILVLYAGVMVGDSMESVHVFTDTRQKWYTAGIMVLAAVLTGALLAILLRGLIMTGTIPYMLW